MDSKNQIQKREIKFRAWDIGHDCFIPVDYYAIISTTTFGAFGIMLKDWDNYREGEYFYSNSQILSQFTGLLDKNGVEIFDGDVLYNDDRKCNMVVAWSDEDSRFITLYDGDEYFNLSHSISNLYYKIGNIYENPELL